MTCKYSTRRQNTQLHCYVSFTGCMSRSKPSSSWVFWRTIVCTAQHRLTCPTERPTSEIVACHCLRSADTTTLQVPSTRRATPGDRPFPVVTARAWNSLPPETRACFSLMRFRRETKAHLFRQSYSWLYALHLDSQQTDVCVELCNSFRYRICKVPRNCVMAAL